MATLPNVLTASNPIPPFADDFIRHGVYLRNWSARTVRTYRQGLAGLGFVLDGAHPSKAVLQSFVIAMRERGLEAGGINMYARTINSYLTWLHEEGHVSERLRIKLLPNPPKPYTTFSDADIRRLLTHAPKGWAELPTWTRAVLLLDTGLRIAEALTLQREHVDLDALVLRVFGKGQKISICRSGGSRSEQDGPGAVRQSCAPAAWASVANPKAASEGDEQARVICGDGCWRKSEPCGMDWWWVLKPFGTDANRRTDAAPRHLGRHRSRCAGLS